MELAGYEDFSLVGSGGNAHVYSARSVETRDEVAVKVLRGAGDEAVSRRFDRERTLMAELSDIPWVVPILESGVTDGGDPYLVMPLYRGGSLQALMTEEPLEWEHALGIMGLVASAVSTAHEKRILHLDIKPANVLLDDDGNPWLGDFGIAEMMGSTASMSAAMMTPAYTPPERLRDVKPNEQTDVYGIGATLFALLAGAPPFGSEDKTNPASVMMAVLNDPVPVDDLPHRVPKSVRNLILRCMSKTPEDRPGKAEDLVALLRVAAEGGEVAPPPAEGANDDSLTVPVAGSVDDLTVPRNPSRIPTGAVSTVYAAQPDLSETHDRKDRKGVWALVAAAVLLFIGVGTAAAVMNGGSGDVTATESTGDSAPPAEEIVDPAVLGSGQSNGDGAGERSGQGEEAVESEASDNELPGDVDTPEDRADPATTTSTRQAAPTTSRQPAPTTAEPPATTAEPPATTEKPTATTAEPPAPTTDTTAAPPPPTSGTVPIAPPNASFSMSTSSVDAGGSVQFTDTSSGQVSSVSWAFSDGQSASGASTSKTFGSAGNVTVTMTARGPGGSDTASRTLTVNRQADPPPRPDNEGCQYLTDTQVQWAFSPLPSLVDTYVLEYSNGSRQDIGKQPGPITTTDNALRKIIAVRDGIENALTVGSCDQHGGQKPNASLPGLPTNISCRFHDFFYNAAGIYTWSETWNWSAGANTASFIMKINQDGTFIRVNNGSSTTHQTVGVNGQSNSGRSVKGIIAVSAGGVENERTIANCGAMGGTGWVSPPGR